jgi:single-stranded DNA-binding protein
MEKKLTGKDSKMIDALISGKLIKTPAIKIGQSGKNYTQFLLSVSTGDEQPVVISGMSFGDVAERIARLQKGDPLAVVGSLKPSEWIDKTTGETKHGLSVTANNSLSVYDIKKRRPAPDKQAKNHSGNHNMPFNDAIDF